MYKIKHIVPMTALTKFSTSFLEGQGLFWNIISTYQFIGNAEEQRNMLNYAMGTQSTKFSLWSPCSTNNTASSTINCRWGKKRKNL